MNTRVLGVLVAPLLLLSSCTKLLDYVKDHPAAVATCCRIDSVTVEFSGNTPQHFHFGYNAAGQPTIIAAQLPGVFQYQDYHFRYDNRGRLKDYLFTDGGGGAYVYIWNRYTYPRPGAIVDTTYDYQGTLSDPNPIYPDRFTSVATLTQDAQGRTTKIVTWTPFSQDTTYTHYNAQGNAVITGVTYDDKVNWYQLSDTWQLVFNNYSRNNPFIPATLVFPASITSYDPLGLPTEFQQRADPSILMVFNYITMDVSYSCDTTKRAL